MIQALLYLDAALVACLLLLLFFTRSPWSKTLCLRLIVTCLVIGILLFYLHREQPFALDVALVVAILGFIDIQFISVFLRKKGDL